MMIIKGEFERYRRFSSFVQLIRIVVRVLHLVACYRRQLNPELYLTRLDLDQVTLVFVCASQCFSSRTLAMNYHGRVPCLTGLSSTHVRL